MAKKGLIYTIAALGVGFLLYKNFKGKVDSYKFLDFTVGKVGVKFNSLLSVTLTIKIDVYNPNKLMVPIDGVFGTLTTGSGVNLGNFIHKDLINISGLQKASFEILHTVNSLKLVQFLAQVYNDSANARKLNVKGIMKTPFFDQQFSQTINLS